MGIENYTVTGVEYIAGSRFTKPLIRAMNPWGQLRVTVEEDREPMTLNPNVYHCISVAFEEEAKPNLRVEWVPDNTGGHYEDISLTLPTGYDIPGLENRDLPSAFMRK